ncbi:MULTISPECIES: HesA/MoeB/ThiF family protein [Bordetella]|uniref:Molybdopterin biosynthesis protein MoeB n=1 Tax=Bordetella genomosp. 6 TaxID=463024 RepID=A0ABX4F7Q4_9BORD|nr:MULTISPECIES: molybdopterin-synthase adenylyltransferase MoeB [Bordetella]AOB25032.1 molybdopterin biosynthesis protein MoeB [Bordetella bronchiseptica]AZW42269.1 molybdopterin-synthase adenylyltransferase MoeB [Bordetella bronchiseptica]KCV61961.1 ThiF family protein [Bordetella bronchiseptica 99-R-0433]MBN3267605.1 molybdopterin-synthase adenylyltransferase MoeB [Bordetella bronchiseptica]OZI70293.1 molybdopterin biosynthesis protein MoeB [Bordetella genomosp. 6]
MNDQQLLRYARHILLDELGIEGQERFLAARVLIIGAGGLGCPAALYLATAGVGHITLVDDDVVELSNLQRQILHASDSVGRAKAESGRDTLARFNPETQVEARVERLAGAALDAAVAQADVVLDCSDNFATRHAINRACVRHRKPLVSGAAIRFDGQVSVYDLRDAQAPCYHCLFPEADDVEELNCATTGVFAPLVGIIGSVQAAEALKLLAGIGQSLAGRLLQLDVRSMQWHSVNVPRDPDCAVCGQGGHAAEHARGDAAHCA